MSLLPVSPMAHGTNIRSTIRFYVLGFWSPFLAYPHRLFADLSWGDLPRLPSLDTSDKSVPRSYRGGTLLRRHICLTFMPSRSGRRPGQKLSTCRAVTNYCCSLMEPAFTP